MTQDEVWNTGIRMWWRLLRRIKGIHLNMMRKRDVSM